MAVHKISELEQNTINSGEVVSLKMAPLVPDGLFEDNGSDIGRLALQLLLELDTPSFSSNAFTTPDSMAERFAIREKLLDLFQQQDIAEIGAAAPKITSSGRQSFRAVLSSQPRGEEMLADPAAMPKGREAASILLAIMRDHFFLRPATI